MIFVLAILLALGGVAMIFEHFRFVARAAKYEGEVVAVEEKESWSSTGSNAGSGRKVIIYIPTWQITLADGRTERISSTEGGSDMNVPIGTKQKVLVDPKTPGTGRPASGGPWFWVLLLLGGSAFLFFADWVDLFQ